MFAVKEHSVNFNVNKKISVPKNNAIVSKKDSIDTFESNTKKQISFEGIHIKTCPQIEHNKIPEIIDNFVNICLKMGITNNEKTVIAAMQEAVPELKAEYFDQTLDKREGIFSVIDQIISNRGILQQETIVFKPVEKDESIIIPAVNSLTNVLQSHSGELGSINMVMFSKMTGIDEIFKLGRAWISFESFMLDDLKVGKSFPQKKSWEKIVNHNILKVLKEQNISETDVKSIPKFADAF